MPGHASWGREFSQLVQGCSMRIEITAAAAMLLAVAAVCAAATRDSKVLAAAEAARSAQLQLLEQVVNIDSGTGDVDGCRKVAGGLIPRLVGLGMTGGSVPAGQAGLSGNTVAGLTGRGKTRILNIWAISTGFGPRPSLRRPL